MALVHQVPTESHNSPDSSTPTVQRHVPAGFGRARNIVRRDSALSGRWHLEGTAIPIAVIKADAQFGRAELLQQYAFIQLTDEEIDAILQFEHPPVDEVAVDLSLSTIMVHCVCGEETFGVARVTPASHAISCICGRKWRLSVTLELDAGGRL
jgi:hypothetical protein